MSTTEAAQPPIHKNLVSRLSVMMLLQYAIWGAWLPLFYRFLTEHHGIPGEKAGILFAYGAIGALLAPFIAGQIADRYFNTEKFLGISHLLGAFLVWKLSSLETYNELAIFSFLYGLIYAPTIPLTNSLALHHLPDRDKDFGKVRLWGTIGWIVVGISIGQWLLYQHTPTDLTEPEVQKAQVAGIADAFRMSAILGAVLGIFCFTLPKTPPQPGTFKFAPAEALLAIRKRSLAVLFLIAFPISCVHQFYFIHTAGYLSSLNLQSPFFDRIFGVGGAGLMTIGQMAEIFVLALLPIVSRKISRKGLLLTGLAAYVIRFAVFAYLPTSFAVLPALALHGFCFGYFFFVAYLIIDEETPTNVRASTQGLFNLTIFGVGIIAGNMFAGWIGGLAASEQQAGSLDYQYLFSIPMFIAIACFVVLFLCYPGKKQTAS